MYVFIYVCVYVCIYGLPTRVRLLRVKPPSLAHARAWACLLSPPLLLYFVRTYWAARNQHRVVSQSGRGEERRRVRERGLRK